jgi:adenylate cyclase
MAEQHKLDPQVVEEVWRSYLTKGEMPADMQGPWYTSKRLRPLYLRLPADPRCRMCAYPFSGFGGQIMKKVFGIGPSKLNPRLCNHCEVFFQQYGGGVELEVTVFFADIRDSTSMAEKMSPSEFSRLINRFYHTTTRVLYDRGALVEKMAGDSVAAFFAPGIVGGQHARAAIQAGQEILKATGHSSLGEPWVRVGIGIHTGPAYVGVVESDSGKDIAVLGDTANTGARLSAVAGPGEIVVSKAAVDHAGLEAPGDIRWLQLKGRSEPIEALVLREKIPA